VAYAVTVQIGEKALERLERRQWDSLNDLGLTSQALSTITSLDGADRVSGRIGQLAHDLLEKVRDRNFEAMTLQEASQAVAIADQAERVMYWAQDAS
jgi:hypothetical protein